MTDEIQSTGGPYLRSVTSSQDDAKPGKTHDGGDGSATLRHGKADERAIRQLQAYWQSLRSGTNLPRRADIDPRRIERLLPYTFIAERIAPGLARLRLAGTHLNDLMGMDVRGMPLSTFITPGSRDAMVDAVTSLFDQPAQLEFELRSPSGYGRPELSGRLLILPLISDLGDTSRAIGCLVSGGTPGRAPRRFDISRASVTPIVEGVTAGSPLDAPPTQPGAAQNQEAPGTPRRSARPPRSVGQASAGKYPPYLRLVHSD